MASFLCSLCLDDSCCVVPNWDLICPREHSSSPPCLSCFSRYLENTILSVPRGQCPRIVCPCLHKESQDTPIINYSSWSAISELKKFAADYVEKARDLLPILCGGCHTLRSLHVYASVSRKVSVSEVPSLFLMAQRTTGSKEELLKQLLNCINNLCSGQSTVEEAYSEISESLFPGIAVWSEHSKKWSLFQTLFGLIPDPERSANLQLRCFRGNPRVWTSCCNRLHCFACKVVDAHPNMSCSERLERLDNSIVHCPNCHIAVVKGDGCNTVTCVCKTSFSWSRAMEAIHEIEHFEASYPQFAARACASILLGIERPQLTTYAVELWRNRNAEAVDRELYSWWLQTYGNFANQACSLIRCPPGGAIETSEGFRRAKSLWTSAHQSQVTCCILQNKQCQESLVSTFYPKSSDLYSAMVFELEGWGRMVLRPPPIGNSASWESQMKATPAYLDAQRAFNRRLCRQFLVLFGNYCPTPGYLEALSGTPLITRFDKKCCLRPIVLTSQASCAELPATSPVCSDEVWAPLPTRRCIFQLRVNACVQGTSGSGLFIGLHKASPIVRKVTFDVSSFIGIQDAQRVALIAHGRNVYSKCSHLNPGDVVLIVVDIEQGFVEFRVNSTTCACRVPLQRIRGRAIDETSFRLVVRLTRGAKVTLQRSVDTVAEHTIPGVQCSTPDQRRLFETFRKSLLLSLEVTRGDNYIGCPEYMRAHVDAFNEKMKALKKGPLYLTAVRQYVLDKWSSLCMWNEFEVDALLEPLLLHHLEKLCQAKCLNWKEYACLLLTNDAMRKIEISESIPKFDIVLPTARRIFPVVKARSTLTGNESDRSALGVRRRMQQEKPVRGLQDPKQSSSTAEKEESRRASCNTATTASPRKLPYKTNTETNSNLLGNRRLSLSMGSSLATVSAATTMTGQTPRRISDGVPALAARRCLDSSKPRFRF